MKLLLSRLLAIITVHEQTHTHTHTQTHTERERVVTERVLECAHDDCIRFGWIYTAIYIENGHKGLNGTFKKHSSKILP